MKDEIVKATEMARELVKHFVKIEKKYKATEKESKLAIEIFADALLRDYLINLKNEKAK